ncbi:MAG TPA: PAS domain S-box protein, partial [Methanocella sp.]|nr:PAS domain S-box protein [Methanocella sp.]
LKADGSPASDEEIPVIRSLQRSELVKNEEYLIHFYGDQRVVLMSSAPVYGPDGRITAAVTILSDITGRKQAEEALRESEQRFKAVFDQADVGIAVADTDGYLVDSNPVYRETLGYAKEELRHKRIYDVTHPEDVDRCRELELRLREGTIDKYQTEKRYVRKDGRVIWGKLNVSAIRDRDGSLKYNLGVMEDITERRQAEDALRESEVRFRSLIQNSSDIIHILDRDGRIVFDSPSSEKILGYPAGHMLGRSPFDFIHPGDRERVRDELSRVYALSNRGTPTEFRIRKADGDYLEVESVGMNLIGVPGVDGIVVNTRPVAERKRAGEALRESEQRFKAIFDRAATGIATADPEGFILDCNAAYLAMMGYGPGELRRLRFWDITHPDDLARNRELQDQMVAGAIDGYDIEKRFVRKDGSVILCRVRASAIRDRDGQLKYQMAIVEDVTERNETEKRLAETTQLLDAALQVSPLAINAVDNEARVLLWNRMAEQLFGWTKEEVLGRPIPTIPDGQRLENDHIHALVKSGKSLKGIQLRRKRKDGTLIDVRMDALPLYDENGKLLGAMGVFREIGPR